MQSSWARSLLVVAATVTLASCGGTGDGFQENVSGNQPPIIAGSPATNLVAGTPYSFQPTAADPDGDSITFSASNLPAWASINAQTGKVTGTPTSAQVGKTGEITISASDQKASSSLPTFQITVAAASNSPLPVVNEPPTIAGTPATSATVGLVYSFTPVGDDPNDDNLTYAISNKPSWATFTPATGQLTGTPAAANVGTTSNISITVTDGTFVATLPSFSIQVADVAPTNRAPTITGTPAATATVGTAYSFRPVGSDPDGNTLRYSIQNQPSWATFSTTSGRLSGTPAASNVGTSARITISVTDNIETVSLPSFTIQVNAAANRAPTISGAPLLSVNVLAPFSFQPQASDPDGDTLTFSATNLPTWATFNTSTGLLSGIPLLANVGTTSGIVISVSDGKAIASLPAFALAVLQVSTGSATLSWDAPTANTDGSPLTLSGYRLVYGQSEGALTLSISITNPGLTTYTVPNLSAGTWYFELYAVSNSGAESIASNSANKLVN
jgi:hypothetical protein